MPAYHLRLRVPASLTASQARSTFYWTAEGPSSFVATLGRVRLGPSLGGLGPVPKPNIEFVRLAAAVYAADRTTPRRAGGSNWSRREFELSVPVYDPDRWESIRERLEGLLAFLSGDQWSLEFVRTRSPREAVAKATPAPARVVLLSGGADSAVGALVSRHELGTDAHVLVSHFGPTILPPIQRDVADMIAKLLPGPEQLHRQIHFSRQSRQPNGTSLRNEYSTRARSLLFLAYGLAVASIHRVPLWIPENGFASLNPPLGPDRRGSLSTRTTHPAFLAGLPKILSEAGVHADLHNPFARATKGEMFRLAAELVGADEASKLLSSTHSCAHTGHRSLGLSIGYQCGVCFGCIVRRSAFAAAGLEDRTQYLTKMSHPGLEDYLAGKSIERSVEDFLDRGVGRAELATLSLPLSYPAGDALNLCWRATDELRTLFP
jgi:7-cyano-7-deazaguanine synthase in queuosine biosynthesis